MSKGRLQNRPMRRATMFVIEDNPSYVRIYREIDMKEVQIGQGFHTHIAPTDRQLTGRDIETVMGHSGPQMNVMNAPLHEDIEKDDIAWTGDQRYRIIALDKMPHALQVLMRQLQ